MAEIVNLRQARKRRIREEKDRQAAQNRASHGRTRSQKSVEALTRDKARAFLDGHRRDEPSGRDGD